MKTGTTNKRSGEELSCSDLLSELELSKQGKLRAEHLVKIIEVWNLRAHQRAEDEDYVVTCTGKINSAVQELREIISG